MLRVSGIGNRGLLNLVFIMVNVLEILVWFLVVLIEFCKVWGGDGVKIVLLDMLVGNVFLFFNNKFFVDIIIW